MELILTLLSKIPFTAVVTLMAAGFSLFMFIEVIFDRKKLSNARSSSDKFFLLLNKKFELNLVKGKTDIVVLADSVAREEEVEYDFIQLLEDYLKHLMKDSKERDQQKIINQYSIIKKMIEEEMKEEPFADLPEEERRLLRSLKNSIETSKQNLVDADLDSLKLLITTKNRIYSRSEKTNRWSVPLALFGLLLTIIFGIKDLFF